MRKCGSIVCRWHLCLPKGPTNSAHMRNIVTTALQWQYLQTELILWIRLLLGTYFALDTLEELLVVGYCVSGISSQSVSDHYSHNVQTYFSAKSKFSYGRSGCITVL
jgi:hypothetical protein